MQSISGNLVSKPIEQDGGKLFDGLGRSKNAVSPVLEIPARAQGAALLNIEGVQVFSKALFNYLEYSKISKYSDNTAFAFTSLKDQGLKQSALSFYPKNVHTHTTQFVTQQERFTQLVENWFRHIRNMRFTYEVSQMHVDLLFSDLDLVEVQMRENQKLGKQILKKTKVAFGRNLQLLAKIGAHYSKVKKQQSHRNFQVIVVKLFKNTIGEMRSQIEVTQKTIQDLSSFKERLNIRLDRLDLVHFSNE